MVYDIDMIKSFYSAYKEKKKSCILIFLMRLF